MRRLAALAGPDPKLEIDAALRPEGKQGPLVRSLDSYASYYERWSEGWEAQALLRAYPLAGDADLGRAFVDLVDPLRWPEGGISSFQAFAVGLAARVGIGNVAGVALAIAAGGPGALFWMWVVALVGMATAFFEATLAQMFKVRHTDGSFRGGPAYYMARGMRSRPLGVAFAGLTIFTCGFSIIMVQSNAVAGVIGPDSPLHLPPSAAAAVLVGLSALVILGGVRRVARVTDRYDLAPLREAGLTTRLPSWVTMWLRWVGSPAHQVWVEARSRSSPSQR